MTSQHLSVREMQLSDVGIRINYFHNASDDHLLMMGVDRSLLPSRDAWHQFYKEDYTRPIRDRITFSLVWELDGEVVGFSSLSNIIFGREAFMHLHILDATKRQSGLGVQFVKKSTKIYFKVLELERILCEPNAFNVAPNRTLQKAGFRYLFTHETTPSPINFPQVVTRWILEKS